MMKGRWFLGLTKAFLCRNYYRRRVSKLRRRLRNSHDEVFGCKRRIHTTTSVDASEELG